MAKVGGNQLPNLKISIDNTEDGSDSSSSSDSGSGSESEDSISDVEQEAALLPPAVKGSVHARLGAKVKKSSDSESRGVSDAESSSGEASSRKRPGLNQGPRKYENKGGAFVTGVDLTSKETHEKKDERARRFGMEETTPNLTEFDLLLLYHSLGISEHAMKQSERGIRLDAIHMRGVDEMSTDDVFAYFQDYAPGVVEWIDDTSCNVVWLDTTTAARAMLGRSKPISHVKGEGDKKPQGGGGSSEEEEEKMDTGEEEKKKETPAEEPKPTEQDAEMKDVEEKEEEKSSESSSYDSSSSSSSSSSDDDDDLDLMSTDDEAETKKPPKKKEKKQKPEKKLKAEKEKPSKKSKSARKDKPVEEKKKVENIEKTANKENAETGEKELDKGTSDSKEDENKQKKKKNWKPPKTEDPSVPVDLPPGRWRLGEPGKRGRCVYLRYATKADQKMRGAEKRSKYYQKYGNPNYGGITGLISGSRKRRMRYQQFAEEEEEEETWTRRRRRVHDRLDDRLPSDEEEPEEVIEEEPEANRPPRNKPGTEDEDPLVDEEELRQLLGPSQPKRFMRMHADDEEEKLQHRRSLAPEGATNLPAYDARSRITGRLGNRVGSPKRDRQDRGDLRSRLRKGDSRHKKTFQNLTIEVE